MGDGLDGGEGQGDGEWSLEKSQWQDDQRVLFYHLDEPLCRSKSSSSHSKLLSLIVYEKMFMVVLNLTIKYWFYRYYSARKQHQKCGRAIPKLNPHEDTMLRAWYLSCSQLWLSSGQMRQQRGRDLSSPFFSKKLRFFPYKNLQCFLPKNSLAFRIVVLLIFLSQYKYIR